MGKQGPGLYSSLASWLYSAGGRLVDFKTGEIFINDATAVSALQFMADLVVKQKVAPPEVTTWEFDEIIAGGQRDRYVMAQTFAPYMTLMNDPANCRRRPVAGLRMSCPATPIRTRAGRGSTGTSSRCPKYTKNADWSIEFIRMACSKQWQLRSMERGNAPPRGSVLRDPAMAAKLGWPPVAAEAIETGIPTPAHPVWDTLEIALRTAIGNVARPEDAKQALDAVAADWQRSLRRAGVGKS